MDNNEIRKIEWKVTGVQDLISDIQLKSIFKHAFDYDGYEYYIENIGNNVWSVLKCEPCRFMTAKYTVRLKKDTMTCDCMSGRRHLLCRHKQMVSITQQNNKVKVDDSDRKLLLYAAKLLKK